MLTAILGLAGVVIVYAIGRLLAPEDSVEDAEEPLPR